MKNQSKSIMAVTTFFALTFVIFATTTGLAGDLEPSAAPGPTMKTLDQIPPTWDRVLPAAERFVLVMNGAAVLDKETGLVWERSPGTYIGGWGMALFDCLVSETGGRKGWRSPAVEELSSLVKMDSNPALPVGHPFNMQPFDGSGLYWSASSFPVTACGDNAACLAEQANKAYTVDFSNGYLVPFLKTDPARVWCVRGGQGYDGR